MGRVKTSGKLRLTIPTEEMLTLEWVGIACETTSAVIGQGVEHSRPCRERPHSLGVGLAGMDEVGAVDGRRQ